MTRAFLASFAVLCVLALGRADAVEPWATYRGNTERTGCTDGKAGPATPTGLWVWQSKEHYIASPVPHGKRLYVPSLGTFNLGRFACLDTEPGAKTRILWSKSVPSLKLPIVSSPGISGGRVVFGDGMHQTDGA